ncbi:hypothetical protein CGLO_17457 [Colletotrichum gloeosporioides Cg-14]|uniref:Protein kinase domain-containing protein n=1 Tax=Colletotrichum gloeosporioides (strain Cg-14) TaxID=1237896 RepID=T0JL01_COLGC|nr:hypothetical protein CGLO_17457 [Colletotrichum gloeosporioides Cg-14]
MVGSPYITAAEQYKSGTQFTLWQYEPVQPHGLHQYDRIPLPPDLPPGCIRNFDLEVAHDTNKEEIDKQAVLQVNRVICGGDNTTVQIVLFDILKAPVSYRGDAATLPEDGTQVVGLLYDTEFYPGDNGAPYCNAEQADGNLSRTDAALKHFFSNDKTGHPHIVPQYYGCWATRVNTYNESGLGTLRCVGLVLEEYINGHSIEDICDRDECDELAPPDGDVVFHMPEDVHDGFHTLEISKELCQEVMKQALNGLVEHMHIGVQHNVFEPRKLFITLRNGTVGLDWPRAVLLGFSNTAVWSKTKQAKGPKGPIQLLELLPYPPHPYLRFSVKALDEFIGFWPAPEEGWEGDEESDFDNEAEFDDWLVDEDVFGPLTEAADVVASMAPGAEWPHPYKKYSLFKTLDPIKPRIKEEREERRQLLEKEGVLSDSMRGMLQSEEQSHTPQLPQQGVQEEGVQSASTGSHQPETEATGYTQEF